MVDVDKFEKESDTMRILRSECRIWVNLVSPDGKQNERSVRGWLRLPWVEYESGMWCK